jgi:hypothetical protein
VYTLVSCIGHSLLTMSITTSTQSNGDASTCSPSKLSSQETTNEENLRRFREEHSIWDLLDSSKPWVLVEDGSLMGYFNWVPANLRQGPWTVISILFLTALLYTLLLAATWMHLQRPLTAWVKEFQVEPTSNSQAFARTWYYNLFAFWWMMFVSWLIVTKSHVSVYAYSTYTVQSWTIVMIRHGLCVLIPFVPALTLLAELLRFPALVTATMTFCMWNFILMPTILLVFAKDPMQRARFWKYFTNFRLTQLHVFNIVFAVLNGAILEPKRSLFLGDLYVAAVFLVVYMAWYYLVLDRYGVHLYAIFSPRSPMVVLTWSLVLGGYVGTYQMWKVWLD